MFRQNVSQYYEAFVCPDDRFRVNRYKPVIHKGKIKVVGEEEYYEKLTAII